MEAFSQFSITFWITYAVIILFMIICAWIIYEKAGKPGWASIIPFYNCVVMLKIVGKPTWWLILLFIPVVNAVISIIISLRLATSFGKGTGFAIGLIFLPFIFYPILAFGNAKYTPIAA
ncbi:MAG: DUF5684 domain-containing protein [Muribaculaceae bacterium]